MPKNLIPVSLTLNQQVVGSIPTALTKPSLYSGFCAFDIVLVTNLVTKQNRLRDNRAVQRR
jgi:hypothetical protein